MSARNPGWTPSDFFWRRSPTLVNRPELERPCDCDVCDIHHGHACGVMFRTRDRTKHRCDTCQAAALRRQQKRGRERMKAKRRGDGQA